MAYIELQTVTIASGTALSPAVALGEKTLVGIVMPAGWDAASMTFQGAVDDATFGEVIDGSSGSAVALTLLVDRRLVASGDTPVGWMRLRVPLSLGLGGLTILAGVLLGHA